MTTLQIDRPEGRIAVSVEGDGPLVVLSPGMGDLLSVFRDVVIPLVAAGFRVASVDLRGHGASSTTFPDHGVAATGSDLVAVVEHLGGPAVLVGHSVSGGAVAWLAARRPDLVAGVALLAPHLQAPTGSRLAARLQVGALIRRPWGGAAWAWYYRSLHKGRTAPWLDAHVAAIRTALGDRSRFDSFRALSRALVATHTAIALDAVTGPALVVFGDRDPEFRDPAAELTWVTEHLRSAEVEPLLMPECGHYPHSQCPEVLVPALLGLLARVPRRESSWVARA